MFVQFSFLISVASLIVSAYALHRRGPQGPPGERGQDGRSIEVTASPNVVPEASKEQEPRLRQPVQSEYRRQQFRTRVQRREDILAEAYSPDFETRVKEIRERVQAASGLIPVDPDAQTSQPDWRKRNARWVIFTLWLIHAGLSARQLRLKEP